jgi:hypothetical protein
LAGECQIVQGLVVRDQDTKRFAHISGAPELLDVEFMETAIQRTTPTSERREALATSTR